MYLYYKLQLEDNSNKDKIEYRNWSLATVIGAYINYIILNYNIMIYDIKSDVSAHFETFSIKSR